MASESETLGGRAPRSAGAQTRKRIAAAAARLFQTRGYAATGMNEIVKRSGAPKGSIYHHFPGGKRDIAVAAAQQAGAQFETTLAQIAAAEGEAGAMLERYCEQLAGWMSVSGCRAGCPVAALALEVAPEDGAIARAVAEVFARWRGVIAQRIAADGASKANAEALASLSVNAVEGALLRARAERDPASLVETGAMLARLVRAETGRGG